MDKKVTGIVAYITIIGWLIAYLAGDKEGAKFHLNQALTLGILSLGLMLCGKILGIIPLIGWILALIINIVNLLVFVCIILGIVYAAQGQDKEVPLLGSIKILK